MNNKESSVIEQLNQKKASKMVRLDRSTLDEILEKRGLDLTIPLSIQKKVEALGLLLDEKEQKIMDLETLLESKKAENEGLKELIIKQFMQLNPASDEQNVMVFVDEDEETNELKISVSESIIF